MIFRKKKIGFVIEENLPYDLATASTRLRCYDVIRQFGVKEDYKLSLYEEKGSYDAVIFQKCFKLEHFELARFLKSRGVKIVLDINVNYLDAEDGLWNVTSEHQENIIRMLEVSDVVLTASSWLEKRYRKSHHRVFCIEEAVKDDFFRVHKKHRSSNNVQLLYCGYSTKAKEILLIEDILKSFHEKYGVQMIYISEKDPGLDFIPYRFVTYNQKRIPHQLIEGDIKISPRNMEMKYNCGHTMTKIAYPMAVGLPVVASPIPSYSNRGAILCSSEEEWKESLEKLIQKPGLREFFGNKGRSVIKSCFSSETIKQQYSSFFKYLMDL